MGITINGSFIHCNLHNKLSFCLWHRKSLPSLHIRKPTTIRSFLLFLSYTHLPTNTMFFEISISTEMSLVDFICIIVLFITHHSHKPKEREKQNLMYTYNIISDIYIGYVSLMFTINRIIFSKIQLLINIFKAYS